MQDGLPPEFYRRMRASRRNQVIVMTMMGIVALGTGLYSFLEKEPVLANGPVALAAGAASVFLYFAVCFLAEWRTDYASIARIVPYFEREVPVVLTTFFDCGHYLARHCLRLDALAEKASFAPLSSFGFDDQWHNVNAPWYMPEAGLQTVSGLMEILRAQPHSVEDAEEIISDLEKIALRLEEAADMGVRFCFHLRMDTAYTGQEFDARRGKY